jgi:predicted aldo/keto reductase-like oxidoreductase
MYNDISYAKRAYAWTVDPKSRASKCTECGKCEELCPQGIKIRDNLKDVVKELEG